MRWNGFANDDDLAMEYTPNFNSFAGGFLIDPNAPQEEGKFGVAIGNGSARNNVFFARPSAGQWHHYAFVMDSAAAAADQIKPYVDGKAVSFTKTASGTGAGNFANSSLNFMSRGDQLPLRRRRARRAGDLQPRPRRGDDRRPLRRQPADADRLLHQPRPTPPTSARPSASTPPPRARRTARSAKYEWDLDGNGSYETNTGATPTASTSYATPGPVTVGLRVTDVAGKTATTAETVSIDGAGAGSYSARVLATAGLINYWRLGEASGIDARRQQRHRRCHAHRRARPRRRGCRRRRRRHRGQLRRHRPAPPRLPSTSRRPAS